MPRNRVVPEWLPDVPANDRGPFHCYIFWIKETRQYYVGHTGKLDQRLEQHVQKWSVEHEGLYETVVVGVCPLPQAWTNVRNFEAALKRYVIIAKRC